MYKHLYVHIHICMYIKNKFNNKNPSWDVCNTKDSSLQEPIFDNSSFFCSCLMHSKKYVGEIAKDFKSLHNLML